MGRSARRTRDARRRTDQELPARDIHPCAYYTISTKRRRAAERASERVFNTAKRSAAGIAKRTARDGIEVAEKLGALALVTKALKETAQPIDDIARSCGFKNGNYLKNLFRSRFGMTMREYRERG